MMYRLGSDATSLYSLWAACLSAFLLTFTFAGESVVEKGDVVKTVTFEGTLFPDSVYKVKIEPEEWSTYKIKTLLPHGADVQAGELLIQCDSSEFSENLADLTLDRALKTLELNRLRGELNQLKRMTKLELSDLDEEEKRALYDYQYYTETEHSNLKERYQKLLENAEWGVKNAAEELKQLKAMYEEDDLTEETEEIILERTEYRAKFAAWAYEKAKEDYRDSIEVRLPRRLRDKDRSLAYQSLDFEELRRELPQKLADKEVDVKKAEIELKRLKQTFDKMKEDFRWFSITSPVAGKVVYGVMGNGSWKAGETTEKFMKKGGKVPLYKDFLTIIPADAEVVATALVDASVAGALNPGQKGYFKMSFDEGVDIPLVCDTVSLTPLPNKKFLTTLRSPRFGDYSYHLTGQARLIISQKESVLRISKKALNQRTDGTYEVSIFSDANEEEGKVDTIQRSVRVGAFGDEYVEVLSGVTEGERIETK